MKAQSHRLGWMSPPLLRAVGTLEPQNPGKSAFSARVAGMLDAVHDRFFRKIERGYTVEARDIDPMHGWMGAALVVRVDSAARTEEMLATKSTLIPINSAPLVFVYHFPSKGV